jgi:uncharacterized protein with PhoU and TrkA domain
MTDWVSRAGQAHTKRKAEAVSEAACTLADLLNREVTLNEMIAAALREAINQCQNQYGVVSAPDLFYLSKALETLDD